MSSKIDAIIGIENNSFQGGPSARNHLGWCLEVNLTPGGRRFGRKEEKKKGRRNKRLGRKRGLVGKVGEVGKVGR